MNYNFLKKEQRVALKLKALYLSYGFEEYKLTGLEEYSLYLRHEDFLSGKDVITFNAGGKLMALRPDVTLSVIKNADVGSTRKLFYDEKVYRANASGGFSEVSQIGAEIIGEVDEVAQAELVEMMLKTLAAAGERCVLDVSHIGVIIAFLDELDLHGDEREFALSSLFCKNAHDFARFCRARGKDEKSVQAFVNLMNLPTEPLSAIKTLKSFAPAAALAHIDELEKILSLTGSDGINLNFSAGGNTDYYNGLVFKGYINGVPQAVLSGGRYDKLVEKLGKSARATGFALYLGELAEVFRDLPPSPDFAVVYGDGEERAALSSARKLRLEGNSVLVTRAVPENFKGTVIYAGEEV